jgi:hypothetical protein
LKKQEAETCAVLKQNVRYISKASRGQSSGVSGFEIMQREYLDYSPNWSVLEWKKIEKEWKDYVHVTSLYSIRAVLPARQARFHVKAW